MEDIGLTRFDSGVWFRNLCVGWFQAFQHSSHRSWFLHSLQRQRLPTIGSQPQPSHVMPGCVPNLETSGTLSALPPGDGAG